MFLPRVGAIQSFIFVFVGLHIQRRRGGMVSHFMCAVAVPPEIPGDKPRIFHSFCKVILPLSLSLPPPSFPFCSFLPSLPLGWLRVHSQRVEGPQFKTKPSLAKI